MSVNARPTPNPLVAAIGRHYGWTALALVPGLALAGPTGEQVVQGAVAVTRPDANTTTVTQSSNGAVVNWHSFSVGGQEYVQFVQPGSNAAILNRVTGGNASQILGRIEANGRVFLVNPQGVYFGAGAKVDTAGFAASTLDINDDDFMQGRYVFTKGTGAPDASVTNAGELTGDQFVVLMGDRVANEGLVQARLGTVALAAGQKVSLQLGDSGLVSFAVDEATVAAHAGVENTGEIVANGGRVLMTAKVANDLVATAVNNAGVVRAVGIEEDGGGIFLRGSGAKVVNSGTLDASGANGGRVLVTSTTDDVEIAAGAVVKATGDATGQGGTVRLVAHDTLDVAAGATVDARGGDKGGRIEVSAHQGLLELDGDIKAGAGGEVVVDPARLAIDAGTSAPSGNSTLATVGKGFIETQLNNNTDVTLVAADEIFATGGPFTIAASGTGDLALRIGQITGSTSASLGVGLSTGTFSVGPEAGGNINLAGISINIQGAFTASAGASSGNVALGAIAASNVTLNGFNSGLLTGNVVTGAIAAANGLVRIEAGRTTGNVSTGPISARTLDINTFGSSIVNGNVNVVGITAKDAVNIVAGNTSGNINIGGVSMSTASHNASFDLNAEAGNITITGPISAVATAGGANAEVNLRALVVNVGGNITVRAGATGGTGELSIDAFNGININGNILVTGGGDSAQVSLDNNGTGNINVNGSVTANGGSTGSISIETNNGNINVNGNLLATGDSASIGLFANGRINLAGGARAVAQASYGSADVYLQAQRGIFVAGALSADAGSFARVNVVNAAYGSGSGDILLQNAVSATSKQDTARVQIINPRGAVRANGLVSVRGLAGGGGRSFSELDIVAGAGGISTGLSGLLEAPRISLTSLQNGPIDVRTKSPDIAVSNAGGASPDVSIDNTAYVGLTTLRPGSGGSYGSYGSYGGSSFVPIGGAGMFGAFRVNALGDLVISGSLFADNALINVTAGGLAIKGSMIVGDRNLPDVFGDRASLLFLSRAVRPDGRGIPLPRFNGTVTSGANAVFRAQNGIAFDGGLAFTDPDTPYVIFMTDGTLDLGPGVFSESSIGNEFLAQFTSFTPGRTIRVEDSSPLVPFTDGPTFTRADHFSKLPGTTMLIGNLGLPLSPHVGSIVVGQNGKVDIGDQNILFTTGGRTSGVGNIVSTGFVGDISVRDALARVFQTPIVQDVTDPEQGGDRKKKDKDYVEAEEGGDGSGEELVAQKTNNGQMCE